MAVVTRTIRASGGDYTTLTSWNATEQTDLPAAGDQHVCNYERNDGGAETARLYLDGWGTDASHYITIQSPPGVRHNGISRSGAYIANSIWSYALTINEPYTRLLNLDIDTANVALNFDINGANCIVDGCLSRNTAAGSPSHGFVFNATSTGSKIRNCSSWRSDKFGILFYADAEISNCLAANCNDYGIVIAGGSGAVVTVKNSASYQNGINWFGGFTAASTNNATSSANDDAPGPNSVINLAAADFVDAANGDYHNSGVSSKLHSAGVNLAADFTNDWEWDARSQWDIGPDEYVASGPATHEGPGVLKADAAKVTGAGIVQHVHAGVGPLKAQAAAVTGLGAIVRAGTGALKAQAAAVVGLGEIAGAISGMGALKAQAAKVVGPGVLIHVGAAAALKAQAAKVVGDGITIGIESGIGVLKAQAAKVVGDGDAIRRGTGSLKASGAKVVSTGSVINEGDLQLTPADIDAIQNAVWQRMMVEGLPTHVLENWQRRGLDPNNPHTISRKDNQIRVGGVVIDLEGDQLEVTQTRRP